MWGRIVLTDTLNGLGRGIRASVSMFPCCVFCFGTRQFKSYVSMVPRKAVMFMIYNRTANQHW